MVPSQIGIARKASIINQHIAQTGLAQLFDCQLDLAPSTASHAPTQSAPVQKIIEHRHPSFGIRRPGGSQMIAHFHGPNLFKHFRAAGQAQQPTAPPKQTMAPPASQPGLRLWSVNRRQHRRLIQFDEGRVPQFSPRVGPSPGRDRLKHSVCRQLVQELMQMALDRFDGLLQDEEHDDGEAQLPLPCEVLRTYAMTPAELQIAELPPQFLDKINDMDGMLSRMVRIPILNSQCIYFVHPKMKLFSSGLLIQYASCPVLLFAQTL